MKKTIPPNNYVLVWCCVFCVSSVVEFLIGWVKISWVFGQKSTRKLLHFVNRNNDWSVKSKVQVSQEGKKSDEISQFLFDLQLKT